MKDIKELVNNTNQKRVKATNISSERSTFLNKNKKHVPIRPHPVQPPSIPSLKNHLAIELPVISSLQNNVQVCILPSVGAKSILQMPIGTIELDALNESKSRSVLHIPMTGIQEFSPK